MIPFVKRWVRMLEFVMREKTGHGFRLNSLRNTGRGMDRRQDKLRDAAMGIPKAFRQYATRYHAR